MNEIKKIISLGPNCNTSITIRNLGIRNASYPWDWAAHTEIDDIINVILDKENFEVEKWNKFQDIGYYLPHDVDNNEHGNHENLFENTDRLNKYKRRFKRFFDDINENNTYLIRFGDVKNLDVLKDLIPNCKIIHIPDGSPDCINTHKKIMYEIGEQDDFSKIIIAVSYYDKLAFPITNREIINFIKTQNEKIDLSYLKKSINEEKLSLVFNDDNKEWANVEVFYQYLREKIYELTGIEYAIC